MPCLHSKHLGIFLEAGGPSQQTAEIHEQQPGQRCSRLENSDCHAPACSLQRVWPSLRPPARIRVRGRIGSGSLAPRSSLEPSLLAAQTAAAFVLSPAAIVAVTVGCNQLASSCHICSAQPPRCVQSCFSYYVQQPESTVLGKYYIK